MNTLPLPKLFFVHKFEGYAYTYRYEYFSWTPHQKDDKIIETYYPTICYNCKVPVYGMSGMISLYRDRQGRKSTGELKCKWVCEKCAPNLASYIGSYKSTDSPPNISALGEDELSCLYSDLYHKSIMYNNQPHTYYTVLTGIQDKMQSLRKL